MTETLFLPEPAVLTPEATDVSLIDAARQFNASYNGHLKRSIVDFWRLGEALSHLFQRRHLQGRWGDILSDIGINVTTDSHARRLFRATTFDGLSEFKNKTQALRFFGILSKPTPSATLRDESSPVVCHDKSGEYTGSSGRGQITAEPVEEADGNRSARAERPEGRISQSKKRRADGPVHVPADRDDLTPPTIEKPAAQQADDSLEVLAMVAARLEILAETALDVTPDHLAQIDRAILALDLLRRKGGVDAA